MKKILILSSSPRRGGNSDTLCDEFLRGATEAGNEAEKDPFFGTKILITVRDVACAVCMANLVLRKMICLKL